MTYVIMEAGKSKIYKVDWQVEDPGRANVAGHLLAEFLWLAEGQTIALFRPLNSLGDAHPHYGEQSILLKVHQF